MIVITPLRKWKCFFLYLSLACVSVFEEDRFERKTYLCSRNGVRSGSNGPEEAKSLGNSFKGSRTAEVSMCRLGFVLGMKSTEATNRMLAKKVPSPHTLLSLYILDITLSLSHNHQTTFFWGGGWLTSS